MELTRKGHDAFKLFLGNTLALCIAISPDPADAIPLFNRYKKEEAKNEAKGKRQGEMYDNMRAGELVLHENIQGNPVFFLANFLASVIYRIKH
ncbi:DUF3949 domain-containing protein [Cytobacillus pseudoceanisediminis]|uniref:DUF3949 domain-containing protein n=1 Tax=Cytobacillus pseudoceanisediminis TaxID=3051614 RepID=UPI003C2F4F14